MTAGVRLYELSAARDILDEFLAETEGEVTPELQQLLDELDGKVEEKVERVALYVREQLATATAIDEEIKRLSARKRAREKAADGLKAYLKSQMERLEKKKVEGLLCTVALQNNPASVRGDVDAAALWNESGADMVCVWRRFVRVIPERYELDRRAVLDAHKIGEAIPPGLSIEQSTSLRIR